MLISPFHQFAYRVGNVIFSPDAVNSGKETSVSVLTGLDLCCLDARFAQRAFCLSPFALLLSLPPPEHLALIPSSDDFLQRELHRCQGISIGI